MAPHGESMMGSSRPGRLSGDCLKRTMSDISFELSKAAAEEVAEEGLPAISEVEEAKCECCGMVEECTAEYIERVRDKFMGRWICGLCSEAVKEEFQRSGGAATKEDALKAHTAACVRFNKLGRAYPVLSQAQAMRDMLNKAKLDGGRLRAKSISPRDNAAKKPLSAGIARSSSCIPAITRDFAHLALPKS